MFSKINSIIFLIVLLNCMLAKAQVVIGDNAQNVVPHPKALLSFSSSKMGIVLPIIDGVIEGETNGNVLQMPGVLYVSSAEKQVKVYMAKSPQNLTGLIGLTTTVSSSVPVNPSSEGSQSRGVVIGNSNTTQTGILVLEDDQKTLVLPKLGDVNEPPHQYVRNPYIGTIGFSEIKNAVFPTRETKKFFWIYGGANSTGTIGEWHLWRSGVEKPPMGIIDDNYFNSLP